jgi:predicted metal-dependent peptidase
MHARLMAGAVTTPCDAIATMAVTVRGAAVEFLYNPRFVLGCALPELVAVLLHEVNHVVFGHVLVDPHLFPDRIARLIAHEVTANEWVAEPLPGDPVTLAQFPMLPPGEDTAKRYRRLSLLRRAGRLPDAPSTLDDHAVWESNSAAAGGDLRTMAVRSAVRAALDALAPEEVQRIPEALMDAAQCLVRGSIPGGNTETVPAIERHGTIPWQMVLRSFVAAAARLRPDYRRPPRRFPQLVGIVPGRGRDTALPVVVAVIDTSASIDAPALALVSAELAALAARARVTVVECDAAVHEVYPFKPIESVRGRGGTDLRPALEPSFLRRLGADCVAYFTDGDGPAPAAPPPAPVLWCITPGGRAPAHWGRVVTLATPSAVTRRLGY